MLGFFRRMRFAMLHHTPPRPRDGLHGRSLGEGVGGKGRRRNAGWCAQEKVMVS